MRDFALHRLPRIWIQILEKTNKTNIITMPIFPEFQFSSWFELIASILICAIMIAFPLGMLIIEIQFDRKERKNKNKKAS